jgi:hypothetical protein
MLQNPLVQSYDHDGEDIQDLNIFKIRIAISKSTVYKLFGQYKAKMFALPIGWDLWKNWQWEVFTCVVAVSYGGRI